MSTPGKDKDAALREAMLKKPARHRPAHWDELVRMSFKLSCGCIQRSGERVKAIDAATVPGHVLICKRCDEFAVCVKVTTYLEYDASVLARLLVAAGVDADVAEYVGADQSQRPQVTDESLETARQSIRALGYEPVTDERLDRMRED